MNLEELGEQAKKENILSILIQMSTVDGDISNNEMAYILQLGFSLGLDEESIRSVSKERDVHPFIPTAEQDRMTILYYLIFLIRVDGQITKEEKEMMHHFGLKLGFSPLMVENIVRVAEANLGRKLPADAILNEIKKHLN